MSVFELPQCGHLVFGCCVLSIGVFTILLIFSYLKDSWIYFANKNKQLITSNYWQVLIERLENYVQSEPRTNANSSDRYAQAVKNKKTKKSKIIHL